LIDNSSDAMAVRASIYNRFASSSPSIALALVLLLAVVASGDAVAQSRSKSKGRPSREKSTTESDTASSGARQSSAEEPTDLAFRTINRTSSSSASRERTVSAPPHLTQHDLRLVETRRRTGDPLVPLRGYPTTERSSVPNRPGYADASIGLHTTGRLSAGYSGTSWPWDFNGNVRFDVSEGYENDNAHRLLQVAAGAGYIIDEGYGVFSGGHMGADVRYDDARYHLFAIPASPVRTASTWNFGTTGANATSALTYDAAARYRALAIDDADSAASRETSLEGTLALSTSWQGLGVGTQGDVRLTYLDGASISYGRVQAFGSYSNRFLTARAGVELAAGENSDGSTSGTIAPTGELRLFPLHGLTLVANITGGLAPTTLAGLSAINPYIALRPDIRQQREKLGYQVHVRIEPSRAFALRTSAARSHYNDYAYFDSLRDGRFAPQYGSAVVTRITGDLTWRIDERNSLLAAAEFTEGTIDEGRTLPFTPKWIGDLLYTHRLDALPLALDLGARYLGLRPASGGRELEPAALVNLAARYALGQRFDVSLELRNVLDSRYQLWEGYNERGFFASIGAAARF
jgi:hypothetical protein